MRKNDLKSILNITMLTLITILSGSFGFYIFEIGKNSEIETFFDSIWWAVVTLTSLGYGDIYPVTNEGRVVAMFLMFFGVVLIGVIAGSVSRHYFEERDHKRKLKLEEKRKNDWSPRGFRSNQNKNRK